MLLLSGSLAEKQQNDEIESINKRSEKEALYDEDLNGNDIKYSSEKPKRKTKRNSEKKYDDLYGDSNFNDENASTFDNPGTFRRSSNSIPPKGKHRKYGRKSKPEKALSQYNQ